MTTVSFLSGPPSEDTSGRRFRWGWLVAGVWLAYLLKPLQRMWADSHGSGQVLGIAAVVAFSIAYLAFFGVIREFRQQERIPPLWQRAGYLTGMLGLGALMIPAAGDLALNTLVYVTAMAMMTLPLRVGAGVAAALFAIAEISVQVVPGWRGDTSYGFGVLLAGLAVFGLRRATQRGWELAEARRDFAELRVQEERTRFARDLHDILGHSLTVVTVKAELAGKLLPDQPDRAATEIADVERLARAALADVRAAVAGYREPSLAGELVSARSALTAAGITPVLPTAVDQVPEDRRELFAWAIREGVTNVVRHSGAARCTVTLTADAVEITDDGRGATGGTGGGHGLTGLRERAAAAGAVLKVGAAPDGGFRLEVSTR